MIHEDFPAFHAAWLLAHAKSSSNQIPADAVVMSVFDDLAAYPLAAIEAALRYHARNSRFAPTVHDVVAVLEIGQRRPSADEAWAQAPRSEADTVCWTEEAASAYALISHWVEAGRWYEAGRGFKAAYERLCQQAVLHGKPLKWQVAIGYDKTAVAPVLAQAVALGRISQNYADTLLPSPTDGGVLVGLLTGTVAGLPSDNQVLKAKWGRLKQALLGRTA
ncbi:MAG: hypothetical protein PHU14_01125 [Methylovulum sp.]|nr:hypothetical protein [Methylovulum sp.]